MRINPTITRLVCSRSGKEVDAGGFREPVGLCRCCPPPGKPVVVEYDLEKARGDWNRRSAGVASGLWRHWALLPVLDVPDDYAADVGGTPVVRHDALSRELGCELYLKNEGGNPSGSFKDRGLAVGIALGAASGAQRFCLPTQGNAGVAACLFSRRLGLPACVVYMPEAWRGSIYHRSCEHFGGEVRFAGANIAAAGKAMRADLAAELASGTSVDLSTFFEPGRLEGKKTMGIEIAESFGVCDSITNSDLSLRGGHTPSPRPRSEFADFTPPGASPDGESRRELVGAPQAPGPARLPSFVIYPTGGGTGLVGIWKALRELAAMGVIDPERTPLPRMVAVQSEQCAPVVLSFERGLAEVEPVVSRGTIADGLDVPGAIMGHGMLAALRESGGVAVAVSEAAIREAFARCGAAGVATSYEGAATLAAARRLRADGTIPEGAGVLLLLTASQLVSLARIAPPA